VIEKAFVHPQENKYIIFELQARNIKIIYDETVPLHEFSEHGIQIIEEKYLKLGGA
jgi:hypothetical protein